MSETLIECRGLQVGHGGRAILPPIDLEIGRGQLWVIMGRNGNGKTTLFRTLLGLLPAVGGRLTHAPGLSLAYVPQRAQLDPIYPALAREVVAMGLLRGRSFLRAGRGESRFIAEALERVGAAELSDRPFRELSEGQKQRVLLARTLLSRPQLALLDEPTSAMDEVAERQALSHLDWLRREHGTSVLIVSHHIGLMRELAERAVLLDASCGEVEVGAIAQVVGSRLFAHNYGPPAPLLAQAAATEARG
ncbi:MAG: ATP-binding cassette domain-containing protein [Myxococcales bacterium]|nr:ATP-binding cassette domain-containing protein [Myxococcales bacterium]